VLAFEDVLMNFPVSRSPVYTCYTPRLQFGSALNETLLEGKRKREETRLNHLRNQLRDLRVGDQTLSGEQFVAAVVACGGIFGRGIRNTKLENLGFAKADLEQASIAGLLKSREAKTGKFRQELQWSITDDGHRYAAKAIPQAKRIVENLRTAARNRQELKRLALQNAFKNTQVCHRELSGPQFIAAIAALANDRSVRHDVLADLGFEWEGINQALEAGLLQTADSSILRWKPTPEGLQYAQDHLEEGLQIADELRQNVLGKFTGLEVNGEDLPGRSFLQKIHALSKLGYAPENRLHQQGFRQEDLSKGQKAGLLEQRHLPFALVPYWKLTPAGRELTGISPAKNPWKTVFEPLSGQKGV
jgi:hypothetical protein